MVDDPQKMLSELGRLGARLIIQRAVEEEFDTWLGRARYERRPERQRGLRNGFRPRRVQTGEGELRIEIPQAREAAMPFVSKLFCEVALQAAAADRPAQGADRRRVRARPIDA
jgi:transposase-like protein